MLAYIWQQFRMPSIGKNSMLLALGTAVVQVVLAVILAAVVVVLPAAVRVVVIRAVVVRAAVVRVVLLAVLQAKKRAVVVV
jgi:hypothetical protein